MIYLRWEEVFSVLSVNGKTDRKVQINGNSAERSGFFIYRYFRQGMG